MSLDNFADMVINTIEEMITEQFHRSVYYSRTFCFDYNEEYEKSDIVVQLERCGLDPEYSENPDFITITLKNPCYDFLKCLITDMNIKTKFIDHIIQSSPWFKNYDVFRLLGYRDEIMSMNSEEYLLWRMSI